MKAKDRSMLVRLRVSSWSGKKLDKRVTNEVITERGAAAGTGQFQKALLPGEALIPCNKAVSLLREIHKNQSLPYDDTHWRILPTENYWQYMDTVNSQIKGLEGSVERLISSYEYFKEQAKAQLNGMYNEADYPDPEEIRSRFAVDMEFRPVPDGGNFVLDLSDEIVSAIQDDVRKRTETRMSEAQGDVWRRLLEVTRHFSNVMASERKDKDGNPKPPIFRDTTVTNLREIVDLAPRLNIAGDPELDRLASEVKQSLSGYDPKDLRENSSTREEAARKAETAVSAIYSAMEGAY